MRIRPQISQGTTGQRPSNPGQLSRVVASSPSNMHQDPLATLNALEQWRVQNEEQQRQCVRWALEQFPLSVHIEPYPNADNMGLTPQEIFAVLRQWEAAYPGVLRFQRVENEQASAHISINWSHDTTLGRDYEVGHTNRTVKNKRITGAEITLIVNPLIDRHIGPQQQRQRLMATILHEVGHALGLEHSENRQDVMYYRGWKHGYLSIGDIQRMKTLYSTEQSFQS